jgi:hypothetical protein
MTCARKKRFGEQVANEYATVKDSRGVFVANFRAAASLISNSMPCWRLSISSTFSS